MGMERKEREEEEDDDDADEASQTLVGTAPGSQGVTVCSAADSGDKRRRQAFTASAKRPGCDARACHTVVSL